MIGQRQGQPKTLTAPIRILQLNVNRSNDRMHILFNHVAGNFDLLLLQEPWWGKLPSGEMASVGHPEWIPILPVSLVPHDHIPRVMAYARRRGDFQVLLRTDLAKDLDFQFLEVRQGNFAPVHILNFYNQRPPPDDGDDEWSVDRLMQMHLPDRDRLVMTGDWNLHHPLWRVMEREPSARAVQVVEWLEQGDRPFTLINPHGEPTYQSHDNQTLSVLDLTFANPLAMDSDTVKGWCIRSDLSCGSDHYAVQWTIDNGVVEIEDLFPVRLNWKHADWDVFQEHIDKGVEAHAESFAPLLQRGVLGEDVLEQAAVAFGDILTRAAESSIPVRKSSPKSKPWWTPELSELVQEMVDVRKEWRRRLEREEDAPVGDSPTTLANRLKRRIRKAKRDYYDNLVRNTTSQDLWDRYKWTKSVRQYPSPPIFTGEGQPLATDHSEKCDAIRAELFQPPAQLAGVMPNLNIPLQDEIKCPPVTKAEVHDAVFGPTPRKAPGPNGIPFLALRQAWNSADEIMFHLFEKCAETGYHPKVWKDSITVAIRKPNKPDYSKPRAYRPIALLDTMGKVLEKIQARRLTHICAKHRLIPHAQFGASPGKSTVDAALMFAHDREVARHRGMATSSLTFDITGFFDFVNHARLLSIMRQRKLPTSIIRWTSCFLSDRRTALSLDGIVGEMKPVNTGVPQGSPASPIIANIYTSLLEPDFTSAIPDLIEGLEQFSPAAPHLIMFVDDGKLYVSSMSLEANVTILKRAYHFCESWAANQGLKFDLVKRELIHYSNRTKDSGISPTIDLPGPVDAGGAPTVVTLVPQPVVKWLGIYWDSKFTFKAHVNAVTGKASKAVTALKLLGNTVRGLSPLNFRLLHICAVLPVMTYASAVWYTGQRQKGLVGKLEVVQNKSLRQVCAAFRTTPIRALQIEASMLPMALHLEVIADKTALRLNRLAHDHPLLQRLEQPWHDGELDFPPPLRRLRHNTRLHLLANRSDPSYERIDPFLHPPWSELPSDPKSRLHINPMPPGVDRAGAAYAHLSLVRTFTSKSEHLVVYADGSMVEGRTGAGYVGYHLGHRVFEGTLGLGTEAEVFDGEMRGLAEAAQAAVSFVDSDFDSPISFIHFYIDNNSAIQTIASLFTLGCQFFKTQFSGATTNFLDAGNHRHVTLDWVPGHQDIRGHEYADQLAKDGTQLPSTLPWSSTLSHQRRLIKSRSITTWREQWYASRNQHLQSLYSTADRLAPSLRPTPQLRALQRRIYGLVLQCRTGHAFLGEYYARHVASESAECPCGEPLQTRRHILRDCPLYDTHRPILREISPTFDLSIILGTQDGIDALSLFIHHSGAFTKAGQWSEDDPAPPESTSDGD
jgi:ribonuclease HI